MLNQSPKPKKMNTGTSSHQQQQHEEQQQQQHEQQQQQWMVMQQYLFQWMMQYPIAAMAFMQQQMMYNQYYMQYYYPHHQQQQQEQQQQQQQQQQQEQQQEQQQPQQQHVPKDQGGDEKRTLWIGDLLQWMDESYLRGCFHDAGEVLTVKIIRNRQTGLSERYGFIEFSSNATADKVLESYNGKIMPNTEQTFRLNWASFSTGDKRADSGDDQSIFVGDLASKVTDALLLETFASKYSSVKGAKVIVDINTGRSKGYGFVKFSDENEKDRAVTEMNGVLCSNRAIRVGVATPKKPMTQQQFGSQGGYVPNGALPQGQESDGDTSNTTIFVGGLDSEVTEEELGKSFIQLGKILSVKIPAGKGCGFVRFADRSNAENAIEKLNGTVIGKQAVRLFWGRTPGNKQVNGAYYGRQGHEGYSPSQNPSINPAGANNGACIQPFDGAPATVHHQMVTGATNNL